MILNIIKKEINKMAEEKKFKLRFDDEDAKKVVNNLKNAIEDIGKKTLAGLKNVGEKVFNSLGKAVSTPINGIKKLGTTIGDSLKAFGPIAIAITLFQKLSEALMKNQKIADLVGTAMNFIQIVINKVVDVVVNTITKVNELTNGFESSKKVIMGLITLGITPLKLAFDSIILSTKLVQLAWEQSPFGKKDDGKIKNLQADIKQLNENLKETANKALKSSKDIVTNVGGMVNEIVQTGTELYKQGSESVEKFNVKAELSAAKRAQNAKLNYGLAAIAAQEEIDKLEAISERHRQDRDDTKKSFDERKKASDDLAKSNKEQYDASVKLAQAHINQAQAELNANAGNADAILALRQAKGELAAADAAYAGKQSEQLAANNGLIQEQADSIKAVEDANQQKSFNDQRIEAQSIKNDEEKIKRLKEIEQAEYDASQKSLDEKMKLYDKDSTVYNNLLLEKINLEKEHNQNIADSDKELTDLKIENDKKVAESKKDLIDKENEANQKKVDIAKQGSEFITSLDENLTQTKKNFLDKQLKDGVISQEQYDSKSKIIEEKAAKRKRSMAMINVAIDTAEAIMNIWAKTVDPTPVGAFKIAQTVAVGALAAAQLAAIASGSVSSSVPSTSGGDNVQETNTVPTTSFSFANAPKSQTEQPIIKAQVVAKEVTNQQQLDRQIISNYTL